DLGGEWLALLEDEFEVADDLRQTVEPAPLGEALRVERINRNFQHVEPRHAVRVFLDQQTVRRHRGPQTLVGRVPDVVARIWIEQRLPARKAERENAHVAELVDALEDSLPHGARLEVVELAFLAEDAVLTE